MTESASLETAVSDVSNALLALAVSPLIAIFLTVILIILFLPKGK